MGSVRIVIHRQGILDLLKSAEVADDLRARAERIALAAGDGHRVETSTGPVRRRATVVTDTFEARHREATGRSLTRAVDAGR